jgi:phage regulator Rha-like protein
VTVPSETIERRILLVRRQKVMLDSDLAELYGVETSNLNKAVKRNIDRFPTDFMFQLSKQEAERLRFQDGTSNTGRGGRRYLPYVFTEQGVAMLSSVLRSKQAVHVNIAIMRAFVRLRELLATHKELARKLDELERKYDAQFRVVFEAIRQLMAPPTAAEKRRIGFHVSSPSDVESKGSGYGGDDLQAAGLAADPQPAGTDPQAQRATGTDGRHISCGAKNGASETAKRDECWQTRWRMTPQDTFARTRCPRAV